MFFAILPDLGFLVILIYVFTSPGGFWTSINNMPGIYLGIYYLLHSFVALGIVAAVIWRFWPGLLPALSGWCIHLMLDIPFHEDATFSTRFLYPILPDFYFTGTTWFDVRILGTSYLAGVLTYIYINRRETRKMQLNGRWKPDIIDRGDAFLARIVEIPMRKTRTRRQGSGVGHPDSEQTPKD